MRLAPVIARLKALCPIFVSVGPALSLSAIEDLHVELPAAFVHPLEELAPANETLQIVSQRRQARFCVLLAARNISGSTEQLEEARGELLSALLGWQLTSAHDPIEYLRGEVVAVDGALIWWRETFVTAEYLKELIMPKLMRRMVVLAAAEAEYGVDPGSGYTAILTNVGSEIQPAGEVIEREIVRQTYSPQGHVIGAKDFSCRLPIELKGGGSNAGVIVTPEIDTLLRACSLVRQDALVIAVDAVTGTFTVGEQITNTTQAGAVVGTLADVVLGAGATATLTIRDAQSTPADNDALAGADSGATAATNGTPTDALVYRPTSDRAAMGSATIHYHLDGIRHVVTGVRGTFSLDLTVGRFGVLSFDLRGIFNTPTDQALPAASYNSVVPPVVFSAGLQIGAWDMATTAATQLTFDLGNQLANRDSMNAPDGRLSIEITGRTPNGSVNPEAVAISTYDPWTIWRNAGGQPIYCQIGQEAGNRVRLLVPHAIYREIGYQDREGILAMNLPFTAASPTLDDGEALLLFS